MNSYSNYFNFDIANVQWHHFYIYFIVAAAATTYLVVKSDSKYKSELFFLSFYLITGNLNNLLTIKIPGFGLFEIQPERFLFFLLSYFILKKTLLSKEKPKPGFENKTPWFIIALIGYVVFLVLSVIVNMGEVGISEALKNILDSLAFLVLIIAFRLMADQPSYDLIGKSIILGAIVSTVVSLVQFSIDPYFLRIGDNRPAFGAFLRSNGIFSAEYFNSYYLIIAIAWTLISVKDNIWKSVLLAFFSVGIVSSFHRMSWIILALVLITYFMFIQKVAIQKLLLVALSGLAIILSVSIFYYQDIVKSTLVKERLSERPDSRQEYYAMVLNNIGKKPVFGYGGLKNEVYYRNLLRITHDRDRAMAITGSLHSGYFSALFLYGIPALICYTFFVFLSMFYYLRLYSRNLYFAIPFLVSIIYLIGNLTNTFLFLSYLSVLFAAHIGIGMGINKINTN